MKKTTLKEALPVPFNLDGKFMFQSEKHEIVHITLLPEEIIPLHTNPFDVVFFIIEGTASLITDEKTEELDQNDTVFIEKLTNRGLSNQTNKLLRVLVFKMF